MKTILVPSLLALFAVGISQQEAKAGFSIDISIGDHHRHAPPVVIARPPVVVARPPVCAPPVVVVPARRCDYGRPHAYVRECDHHHYRAPHWKHDGRRYDSHYRRDAHWRR
jgi:hypothetical protein